MNLSKIERKKFRVRNKLKKVSNERFRLSVNRSTKNISVQIIDDKKNLSSITKPRSLEKI